MVKEKKLLVRTVETVIALAIIFITFSPSLAQLSDDDGENGSQYGLLLVSIVPWEASNAGAQWRRTGTTTWQDHAYTETNVPIGTHTIEFKNISGWIKPNNQKVIIEEGQTTIATGTYEPIKIEAILEKANAIFNWLESEFPEILSPTPQPTYESNGIYFRYYPGTNVYIGTIQNDLYFYDHLGVLHNLGSVDTWLPYAQGIKEL